MGQGLSVYGRKLISSRAELIKALDTPLLVWEAPAMPSATKDLVLTTAAGAPMRRPRTTEPLVFEVRKRDIKHNAFAMGVTVGRTENNDIVIDDQSVSRFHAYFQKDLRSGTWKLVDAESKNGTCVGPTVLPPNVGELLQRDARIKFGDVDVLFFQPETFLSYLTGKMNG